VRVGRSSGWKRLGVSGMRKDRGGQTTVAAVAGSQSLARRFASTIEPVEERLCCMSQSRKRQHAHDQPLPVGRQRRGGARTQVRTKSGQVPAVTCLFQMWRAPVEQRCRADGTGREQGDNKEQYHEHASISGRGEEAVLETKFFDERQGLWEGKKQMQSGSSAERRTSSVE